MNRLTRNIVDDFSKEFRAENSEYGKKYNLLGYSFHDYGTVEFSLKSKGADGSSEEIEEGLGKIVEECTRGSRRIIGGPENLQVSIECSEKNREFKAIASVYQQ